MGRNWLKVWDALQAGERLTIPDVAMNLYGVDVTQYVFPKEGRNLRRFRRERVGHDGTAVFTLQTLEKLILPLLKGEVYDKQSGEPPKAKGVMIRYFCSPIAHKAIFGPGELQCGYRGLLQRETFYFRYTSEWVMPQPEFYKAEA